MRLLLHSEEGAPGWIPDVSDLEDLDHLCRFILDRGVMCLSETEMDATVTLVKQVVTNQEARRLALDLLNRAPISTRGNVPIPSHLDLTHHPIPDSLPPQVEIERLARCRAAMTLLAEMDRGALPQDTREQVFSRAMRSLAATAEVAVILDRFAADDIVTNAGNSGTAWFARALDRHGLPQLELISTVQGRAIDPLVVVQRLRDALGPTSTMRLCVRLGAQSQTHGQLHDRHIRFRYGNHRAATAIALGKGTQVFEKDILTDAFTIALESPAVARERENIVRTSTATSVARWPAEP